MSGKNHPLIVIPADCFAYEDDKRHGVPAQYLNAALEIAGVTPLIVPALGEELDFDAIFDAVDGVLLSGAKSNVNPALYGVAATPAHEPFDPARDATSLPLIRMALQRGVPLLAICRGMQELNVALGGTLLANLQDLPGRDDHRAPEQATMNEKFALRQTVTIKKNTCLAALAGEGGILVNSIHEQAIDRIAPELQVEATAQDGTIEAVSVKEAKSFALGLQWHPEYWAATDKTSNSILKAFGQAVRNHRAGRRRQPPKAKKAFRK